MKHSFIGSLVAITLSTPAFGDVPVPEDFAFGLTVESEGKGALWELNLPDTIYRSVTRPDLGDIRVFNGAGQVVPHVLRLPHAAIAQEPLSESVPFFPLYTRGEEDAAVRTLRIITDEKGMIVDATSEAIPADETDRIKAYLLDISAFEKPPNRLKLAWKRSKDSSFAVTVDVESSDDLSHWFTVVKDVTLADLHSDKAALTHNEIGLLEHKARYLRITWPEALREVTLTGVLASFRAAEKPLPRRWMQVDGAPDNDDPLVYNFDTGGHWPTDRARIRFTTRNVVVHATIMTRSTQEDSWRTQHSGMFYTLEHDGTVLENEPIELWLTSDRYWRFILADKERQLSGSPPTLEIGWMPHLLTFVAQGESPYTVAFGSATTAALARPVDNTLLRTINEEQEKGLIDQGRASSVFTLGGKVKLEPPAPPFPWKELGLWAVLLAGVAMLAWMVRGLFRQMSMPDGSAGNRD